MGNDTSNQATGAGETTTEQVGEVNRPLRFALRGLDSSHPYLAERGIKPETAASFGFGYLAARRGSSSLLPVCCPKSAIIRSPDLWAPKQAVYFALSEATKRPDATADWIITARIDRAAELLKRAARGEFATVVVYSMEELLARDLESGVFLLAQLNSRGIGVRSIQEPEIITEGPTGKGLTAFLKVVETARKQRLKRNILAGQKRAERTGKLLGRPRREVDVGEAMRLSKAGKTVREIAADLKIPKSTVQRILAASKR